MDGLSRKRARRAWSADICSFFVVLVLDFLRQTQLSCSCSSFVEDQAAHSVGEIDDDVPPELCRGGSVERHHGKKSGDARCKAGGDFACSCWGDQVWGDRHKYAPYGASTSTSSASSVAVIRCDPWLRATPSLAFTCAPLTVTPPVAGTR